MAEIRQAIKNDANQLIKVMKNAEESGYMLFNPGEHEISPESFGQFIETLNENKKSGVFVAVEEDRVVGYLIVKNEGPERVSHRAYIVVGIHSDSRGKGIGKALFLYMERWAKKVGLHRLDLTVIVENSAAVSLYKKMGFRVEGIKKDSLFISNGYVDEYYMSKLIGAIPANQNTEM